MSEMFWKKKVEQALDTLALGGMKKVVIKDKDVILEYQGLSIWITESCMRFQLHLQGITADLNTEEMASLTYLMQMRSYSQFLSHVQYWIDEKAKQTNQFGIISKSLQQDMKEINETLKRCEKLLNNLPN